MTMVPGKHNFAAYQGATFKEVLTFTVNGVPVDLSGKKGRMQVRESTGSSTVKLDLDWGNEVTHFTDGTDGKFLITVSAATLTALDINYEKQTWVYDFECYDDGVSPEVVDRYLEGKFTIYPERTRTE